MQEFIGNILSYHVGKLGTWVHNTCCEVKNGKFVFSNLLPEKFVDEMADAKRLGVTPIAVSDKNFSKIANQGTLKYVVTEDGTLLFVPKHVDGIEIKHAVISNGKSVLSAGEAEIFSNGKGGFFATINNKSGHFLFGASTAENNVAYQVAEAAFKANNIQLF